MTSLTLTNSFACGSQNPGQESSSPRLLGQSANGIRVANPPSTTASVEIKKEPSLAEVRRRTLTRKQIEQQPDEERWRLDSPTLASLDRVKKRRWPPQYVSPSPTPQSKKSYKRRNIGGTQLASRSPSLELLSVDPVAPDQCNRRSTRNNVHACSTLPSPPKTPKTPKKPKKAKTRKKMKKPAKKPNVAKPTNTPQQRSQPEPGAAKNTTCYFFLSNDDQGAIPVALDECNTAGSFFGQALAAWKLILSEEKSGSLIAISVSVQGFHWPIIPPWDDAAAFERLMETVAIAEAGSIGGIEVKVKCVNA